MHPTRLLHPPHPPAWGPNRPRRQPARRRRNGLWALRLGLRGVGKTSAVRPKVQVCEGCDGALRPPKRAAGPTPGPAPLVSGKRGGRGAAMGSLPLRGAGRRVCGTVCGPRDRREAICPICLGGLGNYCRAIPAGRTPWGRLPCRASPAGRIRQSEG